VVATPNPLLIKAAIWIKEHLGKPTVS